MRGFSAYLCICLHIIHYWLYIAYSILFCYQPVSQHFMSCFFYITEDYVVIGVFDSIMLCGGVLEPAATLCVVVVVSDSIIVLVVGLL